MRGLRGFLRGDSCEAGGLSDKRPNKFAHELLEFDFVIVLRGDGGTVLVGEASVLVIGDNVLRGEGGVLGGEVFDLADKNTVFRGDRNTVFLGEGGILVK